jgi:hypothetical protein
MEEWEFFPFTRYFVKPYVVSSVANAVMPLGNLARHAKTAGWQL